MPEQVPFISREKELSLIDELIEQKGVAHFLCVYAKGGIGKTRLLQEVCSRYLQEGLQITNIIDFDEQSLHVAENVVIRIANSMDETIFAPFLRAIDDYLKMEKADISPEKLTEEFKKGTDLFIDCFNKLSSRKRIIILFDTIEKIQGTDYLKYLLDVFDKLSNLLCIICGRNADQTGKELKIINKNAVYLIELLPLEENASEEYLQKKQDILHIRLDTKIFQKILFLSGGKPIIMDLAVELLANDTPAWLFEYDNIESLSEQETKILIENFERQLVSHIVQNRSEMEILFLLMSHVYPLDIPLITEICNISDNEAEKLFNDAKSYVFVKSLPSYKLTLHDEFRRMINSYVWDEIDSDKARRSDYSRSTIEYIKRKIEFNDREIHRLEEKEEVKRIAIEREIWNLKAEYLKHNLFVDLDKGIETFVKMFDEATSNNQLSSREMLIIQVQAYINQLSDDQRYEVDNRRINHLLYKGKYKEVNIIIDSLLIKGNIKMEEKINLLIQHGNSEIRLGNYRAGINNFERAKEICEDNKTENIEKLKPYLMRAKNALGWGYRLVGRYEDAITEYEKAREISGELNNQLQEAMILNNLAFAHSRNGNYFGATNFADEANEIWERLNNKEGKASIHHVYSEIYSLQSDFDNAIQECKKALDMFVRLGHIDWVDRLHSILVIYYWERADFLFVKKGYSGDHKNKIDDDLKSGEREFETINSESQYKITALHYLGHIYLTRYEITNNKVCLNKAKQYFKDSYEKSKELSLNIVQLNSLGDLIYIAEKNREFEKLDYFEKEYEEYKREWGIKDKEELKIYPEYFNGLLLKGLGDMYLSTIPSNKDKVLQSYIESIRLICLNLHRRTHYLKLRLRNIQERLKPFKDIKIQIGNTLNELWNKEKKLELLHPETRRFFTKWQKGENLDV